MSVYKLYAAGTGGAEDAAASLDVQFNGAIEGCLISAIADLDADQEQLQVEASFLSTSTFTANDARGSIAMAQAQLNLTTSGGSPGQLNVAMTGMNIPVSAGERLYLHLLATAGTTSKVHVYLYVRDRASPALRRRR